MPATRRRLRGGRAWDGKRAAVMAAFEAAGGSAATVEIMDRYAAQAGALQREACAAQKRGTLACLGRARSAFAALVRVYEEGAGVARAPMSVGQLPPLSICEGGVAGAEPQPPAELVPEVSRLRDRIFGVAMEVMATGEGARLGELERVRDDAVAIGFEPAIAEAEYFVGVAGLTTGVTDRGAAALLSAYERAIGIGYDAIAMEAAARLALHAVETEDAAEARRWTRQAEALVERVDAGDVLHANALHDLGAAAAKQGNRGRARELHVAALAIREKVRGAEHYEVAFSLVALAELDAADGDGEAARGKLERAFGILDRDLQGTPPWAAVKAALGD